MKQFLASIALVLSFFVATAQQSATELQQTANSLMRKGDLDNAVLALEKAIKQEPQNISIQKDLAFATYLKRDFARSMEVAKPLTEKQDADEQSFQLLGMNYKATAQYKECAKLYKAALKKFPNSGVIYNEYGELLGMDNGIDEAIAQWEKGISVAPSYSGNYYNAVMYYATKNDWMRVWLYGEIFVNTESYTERTGTVKKSLLAAYKALFTGDYISQLQSSRKITAFEKAVLDVLAKTVPLAKDGINIDNLNTIRTRFILEWFQSKQQQFAYRLFDQQQYLLREGLFEAYNQWVFGAAISPDAYKLWQENHPKEEAGYKAFQQSRVFSMPAGQYYLAR